MPLKHTLSLSVCPLLLRLGLGVVFLWAGSSKLFYQDPFVGQAAATLANLGVIAGPSARPATPAETKPAAEPGGADPAGAGAPSAPAPTNGEPPVGADPASPPAVEPGSKPEPPSKPQSEGLPPALAATTPTAPAPSTAPAASPTTPAPAFVAEDFTSPVSLKRLYHTAVLLHDAAHPASPDQQLWPDRLSGATTIRLLAWAAALTEFLGGALVLIGFMTRFWALGLASAMAVAMLLTTVGPAAVSGTGFLGFLPDPRLTEPGVWVGAWTPMLLQFVLFLMAMCVTLSGPGAASLDRLILGADASRPQSPGSTDE